MASPLIGSAPTYHHQQQPHVEYMSRGRGRGRGPVRCTHRACYHTFTDFTERDAHVLNECEATRLGSIRVTRTDGWTESGNETGESIRQCIEQGRKNIYTMIEAARQPESDGWIGTGIGERKAVNGPSPRTEEDNERIAATLDARWRAYDEAQSAQIRNAALESERKHMAAEHSVPQRQPTLPFSRRLPRNADEIIKKYGKKMK